MVEKTDAPADAGVVTLDKKALERKKLDFNLHVALIMRMDSANKNKALFQAWLEGEQGLAARLTKS